MSAISSGRYRPPCSSSGRCGLLGDLLHRGPLQGGGAVLLVPGGSKRLVSAPAVCTGGSRKCTHLPQRVKERNRRIQEVGVFDRASLARTRRSCSATREPDSSHASCSVNRASCLAPRQGASSSRANHGRSHLGRPKQAQSGQPKAKRVKPPSVRNVARLLQWDSAPARKSGPPMPNVISPVALTTDASSSPRRPATVLGTKPGLPSQPFRAVALRREGLLRQPSHSRS